jgi:hypothetical protein
MANKGETIDFLTYKKANTEVQNQIKWYVKANKGDKTSKHLANYPQTTNMVASIWMIVLFSGHCTADFMSSAEWTIEKATSVCSEVQKTDSSLQCFAACVSQSIYFYSFSRSRDTRSCYCCIIQPSGSNSVVPDQGMISYKTCMYIS